MSGQARRRRWPVRVAVYGALALTAIAAATFPWIRREHAVTNAPSVVVRQHVGLLLRSCSIASDVGGRETSAPIDCDAFTWAYPGQSVPAVAVFERAAHRYGIYDPRRGELVHRQTAPVHAVGFDDRMFVAAATRDRPTPESDDYRFFEIAPDQSERDASCFYQLDAFECLTPDGRVFSAYWWDLETPTAGPPNDVPTFDRIERVLGCGPRMLVVVHLASGGSRMLAFDQPGILRWSRDVPDAQAVEANCREVRRVFVYDPRADSGVALDLETGTELRDE